MSTQTVIEGVTPPPEPKRRLWQDLAVYLAFVAAMILAAIVGQS